MQDMELYQLPGTENPKEDGKVKKETDSSEAFESLNSTATLIWQIVLLRVTLN